MSILNVFLERYNEQSRFYNVKKDEKIERIKSEVDEYDFSEQESNDDDGDDDQESNDEDEIINNSELEPDDE